MSREKLRQRRRKQLSSSVNATEKQTKKLSRLPNVGDVIVSSDFKFGCYDYDDLRKKGPVEITGKLEEKTYEVKISQKELLRSAAESGVVPKKTKRSIDLTAHDESRGTALFVIEKAYMGGGGEGQNDHYPDYWNMEARRLNPDKTYNETGEVITLTERYLEEHATKIVGAMKMQFVWVELSD